MVTSTKATKHYGVESLGTIDDILDYREKHMMLRDGSIRVMMFTCYISIDDDLQRDQVIRFPFYRSLDVTYSPSDLIFKDTLYQSGDKASPRHRSQAQHLCLNCMLETDLRGVDPSKF